MTYGIQESWPLRAVLVCHTLHRPQVACENKTKEEETMNTAITITLIICVTLIVLSLINRRHKGD